MRAFIIMRDRVTYGRQCAAAMERAGLEVVIVDHGSTYPGAVEWLAEVRKTKPWTVMDCGGGHPRDLWARPWFREMCATERYVVTDPDVVPSDDCPDDWPAYLSGLLDRHPVFQKAGLGLRLDRVPAYYHLREQLMGWEGQFWTQTVQDEKGIVYNANIDTTLAVHVPLMEQGCHTFTALRTGEPYVADHLAWYEDLANMDEDVRYYHEHAETGIVNWTIPGRSTQFG